MLKLLAKGVRSVLLKLVIPKSADEDTKRRELILNVLLAGTLIMLAIYMALVTAHSIQTGESHQGLSIPTFGLILGMFSLLLIISRKGMVTVASHGLIVLYFLGATYGAVRFSPNVQQVLLTFALVIVISSVLIDTAYGFFITAATSAVIAVSWHLQIKSGVLPYQKWRFEFRETDSLELIVMLFLIMVVSWLSNREIEKSLKRARISELELSRERDALETRVDERTRELKTVQMEQVGELSRQAEIGRLSSGIFHDLMNPLTSVIANVDRMRSGAGNIDELGKSLEKAVAASRRMGEHLGMVRRQIRPSFEEKFFSADGEIQEAIDMLRYKSRANNVTVDAKNVEHISLFGNPLKFHRIALNLISNAIDSYGEISEKKDCVVDISLRKETAYVVLTVEDHGCGIEPYLQEKIFEPFFTTKEGSGSGIGLATMKSISENDFGASVSLKSSPSTGSVFQIAFPIRH